VDGAHVMVVSAQRNLKLISSTATPAKLTKVKTLLGQTDATMPLIALAREPAPSMDGARVFPTAEY